MRRTGNGCTNDNALSIYSNVTTVIWSRLAYSICEGTLVRHKLFSRNVPDVFSLGPEPFRWELYDQLRTWKLPSWTKQSCEQCESVVFTLETGRAYRRSKGKCPCIIGAFKVLEKVQFRVCKYQVHLHLCYETANMNCDRSMKMDSKRQPRKPENILRLTCSRQIQCLQFDASGFDGCATGWSSA